MSSVGRDVRRVDQIHKCWRECRDVRVDMFSLVFRCLMPLWRHASNEDVLMVGDYLEDFQLALAWIPSGAPEEAFDLIFEEYLRYALMDFHTSLVCVEVRNGVRRRARLQRCVIQGLVYHCAAATRRCDLFVPFQVTGEAAI